MNHDLIQAKNDLEIAIKERDIEITFLKEKLTNNGKNYYNSISTFLN